jgi:hypothetical protein
VPRAVKDRMSAAARVLDWSVGDWVLAAAAEHGPRVPDLRTRLARRPAVADATFCALYLTSDEREELDEQAVARGLNRSAFVTAVSQLALGAQPDDVVRGLQTGTEVALAADGTRSGRRRASGAT